MKTTLKARLLRLGCLTGAIMGILMTIVGTASVFIICRSNGEKFGKYIAETCAGTMSEEFIFISQCLENAEPSEDGDDTFDRVFMSGDSVGYDYSAATAAFNALEAGKTKLSDPVKDAAGEYVTLAGQKKADGTIVIGELGYDYFVAILNAMKANEGDVGFIADKDGKLILASDYEKNLPGVNVNDAYGFTEITNAAIAGQTGNFTFKTELFSNDRALFSYTPIESSDLYVIYGSDYDILLRSYYLTLIIMVSLFFLLFAMTTILSISVARHVSQPVKEITDRLVKLSEGDLDTQFSPNNRGDETQVLSEAMEKTIESLSSYVSDIDNVLAELCNGNLKIRSDSVEYLGNFENIQRSLNEIATTLSDTMHDIQVAGEQVYNDSEVLSVSAQTLADNSSTEAATLEEINSMSSDIAAHIEATNANTEKASELLENVIENVQSGNKTMEEMSGSMTEIKQSSDEIQKIVKIIDDIAFQTNILALNAAVEAARAGEAGKGFAVVADEVRNLAGKSAEAAKNTMELVTKSSAAVERGTTFTAETDKSLRTINDSISQFGVLMKEISSASQDQEQSIKQINIGLDNITNAVQSNSATAQESAASSQMLKTQAEALNRRASHFTL